MILKRRRREGGLNSCVQGKKKNECVSKSSSKATHSELNEIVLTAKEGEVVGASVGCDRDKAR